MHNLVSQTAPQPTVASKAGAGARPGSRELADALRHHRQAAALRLVESLKGWRKYAAEIASCAADPNEFLEREVFAFVDYLTLYFRTGDATYKHLYVGEKLKQLYDPQPPAEEQQRRKVRVTGDDAAGLVELFRDKIDAAQLATLETELRDIARVVTTQGRHTLSVLLVGDCLFIDILSFLTAPALEDGVTIRPTFVTSKNAAETRNAVRALADRKFDLVCYSPFSYEFSPEIAPLMNWRRAIAAGGRIREMAGRAMAEAAATLDLLSDLFECNLFVHNTAAVRRHDGSLADRMKNRLSAPARSKLRSLLNPMLREYVQQRNASTFEHLFLVDEVPVLEEHGDVALGRMFYDSDLQHPAAFGKFMADAYHDVLAVHALLLKKKLIVCDLDNTLWKGVIGEGNVEHYAGKQRTLKRLQAKGVVLAINSKNDPKNVRWDGGVLCENDFVCAQINWDPKVVNIKRIGEFLNLKTKDFVFIDDRGDEREMMNMAVPDVHTMDAIADRTWRLLALWADVLAGGGETDRTQFYKQREVRQSFLEAESAAAREDQEKLFEKLGVEVTIREARKSDLKRVAELINRTNQFNLCGSRISVREITAWHESGRRKVFVVDAADKFGDMGTVSILLAEPKADRLEIPVFVLSCRVFGYGIENALLNHVKRLAAKSGPAGATLPVLGLYQETMHNEPCRKVYPDNGFTWDGAAWVYAGGSETPDPKWLRIRCEDPELVGAGS